MALVLADGFDHYDTASAPDKFWSGGGWSIISPGRGFGGQCLSVIINNPAIKQLPSIYTTIIVGCAIMASDTSINDFLELWSGSGMVAKLGLTGGQLLRVSDSTGTAIATGTTIVPINRWVYVELKVIVGSPGHATVQLNGAPEIASTAGTFGASGVSQLRFENGSLSGNTHIDDLVVLDTTGSSPQNTFLGDIRIVTLYPVADGSHTAWTPDTGTDHYSRVNEHLIDGDASYVKDATPGDKDSYILETFIGLIYSAQLNLGARKGEAAVRQIAPLIRQAGTDYVGATSTLSTDYLFYSWILDNDPTGSPWLASTINADEFGQSLIS